MPQISVIVPVYNVEKYLHRCIDSLLANTFTDFELILIDDGSPDNCGKICDEYAEKDSRIVVIHQKNSGVSTARNNGIKRAEGDYVTFIDSDDWVSENYLEELYSACVNYDAQMAVCDYAVAESLTSYKIKECTISEKTYFSNRDAVHYYAIANLDDGNAIFRSPWAKLIKREIALTHLFPVDREYAEDAACVYLWLWDSKKTIHVNDAIYYYYKNLDGVCCRPMTIAVVGNFETEKEWISFFERNGFADLKIKACNRYLSDCFWAINGLKEQSLNDQKVVKKIFRYGLRKYAKTAGINVKNTSYYYEIAFPKEMKFYWYWQALKRKLKRK